MIKPKTTKRCKKCRKEFKPYNTMESMCVPCAIQAGRKEQEKKAKYDRKIHTEKKQRSKGIRYWLSNSQASFNAMRRAEEFLWFRERGLEPECISCGKQNMDWCCGHFKTVGHAPELRFDRTNTFLQCNNYCNKNLSGNISGNKNTRGYRQGLVDRFGQESADSIITYCELTHISTTPYTFDQLKQLRSEWNKRTRDINRLLSDSREWGQHIGDRSVRCISI